MNKVVLMGRLTRDPDVRYTSGENTMAVARYTLAVDRRRSRSNADGQTADFISCVAFGKSGEFAEKYLHKGTKICLSGRIQTGSYTNKDGVKVYTTDVVVEDQEFAESKNAQTSGPDYSGYPDSRQSAPAQRPSSSSSEKPSGTVDGFMNIPDGIDEELPFA
ncbi:MAG: single-stranded DNA-binding protein [Lachnospiraceae bacterium]|jgi:single-strand DNA-binding protein|nr:single-stranded DNA-binding protein [Lachnospiraceae bacterium]